MEEQIIEFPGELGNCPFSHTLSIIGGKWKIEIVYLIFLNKKIRYGRLKSSLTGITHKVLNNQLKELSDDGLLLRTEYPTIPPQVEYELTDRGLSLFPILKAINDWGINNIKQSS
jgi:DNA-binding HxlR family transcriptional regulator